MALHTIIRLGIVASTVLPYAYAEPNPDALAACKTLEQKFPKQVADSFAEFANPPIGVTYTETRHDYWSQANADVKPACIFFPKTAEDIQFAVQTLNKYPDAPWAVKGGGHNPNVGFSSTQDGVLIATHEHMAKTTMDDDKNARVGPGCKWIDVMKALEPFGRATVSGRLGVVGAAGLTLGGGLSFLSAEHVSGEDICLLSSTVSLTHL
jgi:FAD/FMN-containing dehydrogenase